VIAIHAALLFAFLHMSGRIDLADPQSALRVFDVAKPPPPPPPPPPPSSAAAAQAEGEGGRLGAQEHQERGDAGGRAQAADRDSARAEDRGTEIPAPGRRADPGRVRRARAGHRRGRGRHRHRQRGGGNGPGGGGDNGVADPPRLLTPVLAAAIFRATCSTNGRAARRCSCAFGSTRAAIVSECIVDRGTGIRDRFDGSATSRTSGCASGPRSTERQAVAGWFGYGNAAAITQKGIRMIEAEWWEYDSLDELADAVAGDVGFIIESAVDARNASLIAVPGGKTGPAIFPKLAAQSCRGRR
jgi:protein TonB